jgi:hypothetical protein
MGQPLVLDQINPIGSMGYQRRGERFDAAARQHGADLDAQPVGQLAGLAAELQRDVVQLAVFLLGEYPNFALTIRFDHFVVCL